MCKYLFFVICEIGGFCNNANGFVHLSGDSLSPKAAEGLNQVALPVVPYDTCKRMDYWWFQVKTSMICCGYALPDELKAVCQVKDLQLAILLWL